VRRPTPATAVPSAGGAPRLGTAQPLALPGGSVEVAGASPGGSAGARRRPEPGRRPEAPRRGPAAAPRPLCGLAPETDAAPDTRGPGPRNGPGHRRATDNWLLPYREPGAATLRTTTPPGRSGYRSRARP